MGAFLEEEEPRGPRQLFAKAVTGQIGIDRIGVVIGVLIIALKRVVSGAAAGRETLGLYITETTDNFHRDVAKVLIDRHRIGPKVTAVVTVQSLFRGPEIVLLTEQRR